MQKFTYHSLAELLTAAQSCGVSLPHSTDLSILGTEKQIGTSHVKLKNRLTIHPMEGFDGNEDGSPGEWTMRRCERLSLIHISEPTRP